MYFAFTYLDSYSTVHCRIVLEVIYVCFGTYRFQYFAANSVQKGDGGEVDDNVRYRVLKDERVDAVRVGYGQLTVQRHYTVLSG